LAVRADELGFDLVFALATWLGKGGYGGTMRFREQALDPFITSAALAPLTHNVLLISTVHILYGWHPLHIAKYGAVIDHISGGRWGINVVTGYRQRESRMFGFEQMPMTSATPWQTSLSP
jgi:FMNH2-dependent dimethyl sulfone monooxygenase